MPWKHTQDADVQLHSFLTSTPDEGEWSTSRSCRFIPWEAPRYPFNSRLGWPQSRSGRSGIQKNPCRALQLRIVQPKAWPLYRHRHSPPFKLMLSHEVIKNCDVTILFCNLGMHEERLGNFFRYFPFRSLASVHHGMQRCSHLFWRKPGGRPHNAGYCDKWHCDKCHCDKCYCDK